MATAKEQRHSRAAQRSEIQAFWDAAAAGRRRSSVRGVRAGASLPARIVPVLRRSDGMAGATGRGRIYAYVPAMRWRT